MEGGIKGMVWALVEQQTQELTADMPRQVHGNMVRKPLCESGQSLTWWSSHPEIHGCRTVFMRLPDTPQTCAQACA